MKLPIRWLLDYLPATVKGANLSGALAAACKRWDLTPGKDDAQTLAKLMTFSGFNCDGVHGAGEIAVLELDVLSNRPDGQCIVGLAREVAAILQVEIESPKFDVAAIEQGEAASRLASVKVEEPELCPRYTARVIRGVKVGPSPQWLKDRLESIGLQSRNNIVDVTNFICFELNQPLHAFDLNTLEGRQIIVRKAQPKEAFTPLYGEIPALTPETLVIADGKVARAVAGVLGGKGSEVTPQTTDILLEAAYFNPANTRRTVRRLKVMDGRGTDSSYRFERGIDIEAVDRASARAARLIVEVAGGSIAPGIIDVWSAPRSSKSVDLRFAELNRVFGAEVPPFEAKQILTRLGCKFGAETTAHVGVTVPSWRRGDLEREIDLIEEVARLYGFNKVPETTAMSARVPPRSRMEVVSDQIRTLLTALGYFETITNTLIDPKMPAPAVWTNEKPLPLDEASVLSKDNSALRNSVLASLLSVRKFNQDHRTGEARLFELGKVFLPAGKDRPEERHVLALIDDRGFQHLADTISRLGSALELEGAHLKFSVPQSAPAYLAAGQACHVMRVREMPGNERAEDGLGWMGKLSPDLQKAFDLRESLAMCELDLAKLAALPSSPARYSEPPQFPEVMRDIAMVVDESVNWSEIESFARAWTAHEVLRDKSEAPRFQSVFRGKQIGAGKKSVAFSIVYRASARTLTDDEVNAAQKKFQDAILAKFNATLRA
jgi:phenylalanyl-tRNA synthetase beta chain